MFEITIRTTKGSVYDRPFVEHQEENSQNIVHVPVWEGLHNPPPNSPSWIRDNHINTPIEIKTPKNSLAE